MTISLWCLVAAAAASAAASAGHGSDTLTHPPETHDLVYQLHELAERVQLPPERDYELAAALYAQGIALEPLNAALRYNAGIVQKNLGNHRAAIELYEAALKLDPSLRQAEFNLARSLQMLSDQVAGYADGSARHDDLVRALGHFEASVTAAEPGGLKNAEEVLYQLGRVEEARAAYMQYVQLRPRGAVHTHDPLRCHAEGESSLREYLLNVAKLSVGALAPLPDATLQALCGLSLLAPSGGEEEEDDTIESYDEQSMASDRLPLLQPAYTHVPRGYRRQRHSAFECPAALSGQHGADLAAYYDVWHQLGLTYREDDPHSEDFLARGRHALDNEALSLFIADQLAPSVSEIVGTKVKTSFTKVAVMDETAYLPKHRDEATSEFTITAVLRAEVANLGGAGDRSTAWPIHLQGPPTSNSTAAPDPLAIDLGVGDCLFFNGRDFLHWRHYTDGHPTGPDRQQPATEAARYTMLLLHYVHDDFPESSCARGDNGGCILKPEYRQQLPSHLQAASELRAAPDTGGMPSSMHGQCQANELCEEGGDGFGTAGEMRSTISSNDGVEMVDPAGSSPRYLMYSPCVITTRPGICSQQFNNQLWALQHALAVAEAMGRVLVLPEFMVLKTTEELLEEAAAALAASQSAPQFSGESAAADGRSSSPQEELDMMLSVLIENGLDQRWFPTGHFFDLAALRNASTHGVIETEEFLETVGYDDDGPDADADEEVQAEEEEDEPQMWEDDEDDGPVLRSVIVHPPYLVPRRDARKIYDGAYYRELGLRWLHGPPHSEDSWARPTRISVHSEVVQAKSGRGQTPYIQGEGRAYWAAAEDEWASQAVEVSALLTAESSLPADAGSAAAMDQLTSTVMTEHNGRLDKATMSRLGLTEEEGFGASDAATDDDSGLTGGDDSRRVQQSPRVIAFDFAPSYNFNVDRLHFDPTLRDIRRRFQWVDAVTAPASRLERALRADAVAGGSEPSYVAIHLRRRGYSDFCSNGLDFYQRMRFGVEVTEQMCWPSAETVAEEALAAARAIGTDMIFVATDEPDEDSPDIAALRASGLRVWLAPAALIGEKEEDQLGSELRPLVEQAVCAAADHFIGNLASTFSFAIAQERDVRSLAPDRVSFWNSGTAAEIATSDSAEGSS